MGSLDLAKGLTQATLLPVDGGRQDEEQGREVVLASLGYSSGS